MTLSPKEKHEIHLKLDKELQPMLEAIFQQAASGNVAWSSDRFSVILDWIEGPLKFRMLYGPQTRGAHCTGCDETGLPMSNVSPGETHLDGHSWQGLIVGNSESCGICPHALSVHVKAVRGQASPLYGKFEMWDRARMAGELENPATVAFVLCVMHAYTDVERRAEKFLQMYIPGSKEQKALPPPPPELPSGA